MAGYILCQLPRAKAPFFIESISTNIYSLEELCYFCHQNPYLVNASLFHGGLCRWLREDLGLEALGRKLEMALAKGLSIRSCVYPLFKEINYLTYEEMKAYDNLAAEIEKEPENLRLKNMGDSLMENGMYVSALHVYQELLREPYGENDRFHSSIYHNMGCAHSYLFQKEEALACFEKAYVKHKSEESLKSYLFACYYARPQEEYEKLLGFMGIDGEKAEQYKREIEEASSRETENFRKDQLDSLLDEIIREYHRNTV